MTPGLTRVLLQNGATISHTFVVDETPTAATGSVTYAVTRLDGTSVTSGTASTGSTTGQYTLTLAPQSSLDTFIVTWAATVAGTARSEIDYIEIVGGFICDLYDIRNSPPAISTTQYTTDQLKRARLETEQECEDIIGQAVVPRFGRFSLVGNDDLYLLLPVPNVRKIRAVSIAGVALSAGDLANVTVSDTGVITRSGAFWLWNWNNQNIIIECEHGLDRPPSYISTAAVVRARTRLGGFTDSKIPYRATNFTVQDGGTYRLSNPTRDLTGIAEVDAAYAKLLYDSGGFA